ncbi:MAG: hypothetical protein K9J12_16970 [Melioribacteraceae bacterium]|nr:hypothetical protein [Melioribacteraceae bacterium]MCF8263430.1 hypothetical protein [Melioribacteraceae bacterium]MCF8430428.1 hypothetical protein [Melioribacteraceae bacterium]
MNLIDKILTRNEFLEKPPVLVDIGASGQIHERWKKIAKYSVCIAFDADDRDLEYSRKESKDYKELIVINSLVNDVESENQKFYLTAHPHCSSMLPPDSENLKGWSYAPKFEIDKVVEIKATTIGKSLDKLNISYIDWMKSDSQGLDLRLFKSIGENIRNNIFVVEFEPGIMHAYQGEDKMYQVLEYMTKENQFWMSDFILKGAQKFDSNYFNKFYSTPFKKKLAEHSLKKSPGWAEMIYINSFNNSSKLTERDFLLGWIVSTLQQQHGFAYELALKGKQLFDDNQFAEMEKHSEKKIKNGVYSTKLFLPTIKNLVKRFR